MFEQKRKDATTASCTGFTERPASTSSRPQQDFFVICDPYRHTSYPDTSPLRGYLRITSGTWGARGVAGRVNQVHTRGVKQVMSIEYNETWSRDPRYSTGVTKFTTAKKSRSCTTRRTPTERSKAESAYNRLALWSIPTTSLIASILSAEMPSQT